MVSMHMSTPKVIEKKAKKAMKSPKMDPPAVSDSKPPPYCTRMSSKKTVAN
jgi:hypothetical protein